MCIAMNMWRTCSNFAKRYRTWSRKIVIVVITLSVTWSKRSVEVMELEPSREALCQLAGEVPPLGLMAGLLAVGPGAHGGPRDEWGRVMPAAPPPAVPPHDATHTLTLHRRRERQYFKHFMIVTSQSAVSCACWPIAGLLPTRTAPAWGTRAGRWRRRLCVSAAARRLRPRSSGRGA